MKPYPAYKNPSLPWVEHIPAGWDALPNIALFDERIERGFITEELLSVTQDRGIIRQSELEEKKDSSNEDKSAYKRVRVGDIAYNKMRMWQGAVGHSPFEGIVSPAYIVLKPKRKINPRYYHYLFRTPAYTRESYRNSYGICDDQLSLRFFNFKRMQSIIPPVEEQDAIVAFLEAKEQEIQTFIANKRRMIELLKEQKNALINRAVTRGLNPKAPLKLSGIPWLREIPKHWEIVPLKHLSRIQTGVTLGASYGAAERRSYPYLRVANVQSGFLDLTEIKTVDVPESEARGCKLQVGDVLMTEGGDFDKLGRGYVWRGEITDCLHQNHIFAVRTDQQRLNPEFFAAELTGHHAKTYFTLTSKKTTNLASTNKSKLGVLPVLLPTLAEQRQILTLINEESGRGSQAIATAEREITLMEEYRTALIAAAVTGKIDVRTQQNASPLPPV